MIDGEQFLQRPHATSLTDSEVRSPTGCLTKPIGSSP
jgi:hypothetical protein